MHRRPSRPASCRLGTTAAAAHAIAFQLWLASSLLVDALAVAAQTLVATHLHSRPRRALATARRVLVLSLAMGATLGVLLCAAATPLSVLFTRDGATAAAAAALLPIVAACQPLNALAFAWDGIIFGAGGFRCVPLNAARRRCDSSNDLLLCLCGSARRTDVCAGTQRC